MATAERNVADAILQKPMLLKIGGVDYSVAPPTTATLIEVSAEVSKLPSIIVDGERNIIDESLRIAKDCRNIGDILAILILGAKNLTELRRTPKKHILWFVTEWNETLVDKKKELGWTLLNELPPSELSMITSKLLNKLDFGSFFGFTTSLIEVNMIRPTKEVEKVEKKKTKVIASGQ